MVAEHNFTELEFWGWHMEQVIDQYSPIVPYAQGDRNAPNSHYTHNDLNAQNDLYAQMDQLKECSFPC
jgi:hypothetical protein